MKQSVKSVNNANKQKQLLTKRRLELIEVMGKLDQLPLRALDPNPQNAIAFAAGLAGVEIQKRYIPPMPKLLNQMSNSIKYKDKKHVYHRSLDAQLAILNEIIAFATHYLKNWKK